MTIEEKLTHFYDTSVEEARVRRKKMYRSTKTPWMPHWRNIKKCLWKTPPAPQSRDCKRKARDQQGTFRRAASRSRRDWTARTEPLKRENFLLKSGTDPEIHGIFRYEEYLCTKIEEAVCFAEHDEIQIYLSKEDEPRLKSLTVKTGFPLKLSDESFIGGIRRSFLKKTSS